MFLLRETITSAEDALDPDKVKQLKPYDAPSINGYQASIPQDAAASGG